MLDYLNTVHKWLLANPNEVLTLLFTNPEGVSLSVWDSLFKQSGVADLAYTPPSPHMQRNKVSIPTSLCPLPELNDLVLTSPDSGLPSEK